MQVCGVRAFDFGLGKGPCDEKPLAAQAKSGADGAFTFPGLAPGNHYFVIRPKDGKRWIRFATDAEEADDEARELREAEALAGEREVPADRLQHRVDRPQHADQARGQLGLAPVDDAVGHAEVERAEDERQAERRAAAALALGEEVRERAHAERREREAQRRRAERRQALEPD